MYLIQLAIVLPLKKRIINETQANIRNKTNPGVRFNLKVIWLNMKQNRVTSRIVLGIILFPIILSHMPCV